MLKFFVYPLFIIEKIIQTNLTIFVGFDELIIYFFYIETAV